MAFFHRVSIKLLMPHTASDRFGAGESSFPPDEQPLQDTGFLFFPVLALCARMVTGILCAAL